MRRQAMLAIERYWEAMLTWHTLPWYRRAWLRLVGRGPRRPA